MTKSKKQFAKQPPTTTDDFHRAIELAFSDHPWPASRSELLEHASRQSAFAKSDLARLKRIPHREYRDVRDLMTAAREADATGAQGPGPVTTAHSNRRAMGDVQPGARVESAVRYDEQIH